MPTGRNRWRAPVAPKSSWRRSSPSLGSPGNAKEWRKQSINGPWKRFVFANCRGLHCLFEDRSRPVFVSTERNSPVRSVRLVYAVCTRPVQTGLFAKSNEVSGASVSCSSCSLSHFVVSHSPKERGTSWSGRARSKRRAGAGSGGLADARPGTGVGAHEEGVATAPRRVGCLAECEGLLRCCGVMVIISWANVTLHNVTLQVRVEAASLGNGGKKRRTKRRKKARKKRTETETKKLIPSHRCELHQLHKLLEMIGPARLDRLTRFVQGPVRSGSVPVFS